MEHGHSGAFDENDQKVTLELRAHTIRIGNANAAFTYRRLLFYSVIRRHLCCPDDGRVFSSGQAFKALLSLSIRVVQ